LLDLLLSFKIEWEKFRDYFSEEKENVH